MTMSEKLQHLQQSDVRNQTAIYYEECARRWEQTDKSSREAIMAYNEWRRQYRKMMMDK